MTENEIRDIISKWQCEDKEHRSFILVLHDETKRISMEVVQGRMANLVYSIARCLQNKNTVLPSIFKNLWDGIFYLASRKTDVLCKN